MSINESKYTTQNRADFINTITKYYQNNKKKTLFKKLQCTTYLKETIHKRMLISELGALLDYRVVNQTYLSFTRNQPWNWYPWRHL